PFGAATVLSLSSPTDPDYDMTVSSDGLTAMFESTRGGATRIFVATRANTLSDFGTPGVLSGISSTDLGITDSQPFLTADGQELYFATDRAGGLGQRDIWRATWNGSAFANPMDVAELNSATEDWLPALSADRLTIYFARRDTSGQFDIYRAHR